MKKKSTPLVDEYLQSIQGMQEAGTDEFFYTRLKARMERSEVSDNWSLPLKPVWVVGTLSLLFAINIFMVSQQAKTNLAAPGANTALQNFAESYDQAIASSY
jgi:hypothetical protein